MQGARVRNSSGRRTASMALGGIALMGAVGLGIWWTVSMRIPALAIPNPKLPTPNAFHLYAAAGDAISGRTQLNNAVSKSPDVSYTLAQEEDILRQNAGVFQSVHQAFAASYLNPPERRIGQTFPQYTAFLELARLLDLQAKVRGEEGNWSGAAESCLDGMRIGQDIPKGAALTGALVGDACQTIGRQRLWEVSGHLNAKQAHTAADRLKTIIDRRVPFVDTLQEEKWAQQADRLGLFGEKSYADPSVTAASGAEGQPAAGGMSQSSLLYGRSRIMDGCTSYMDALIAQSRQPYAAKLTPPPVPSDPINKLLLPVVTEVRVKSVNAETQNALLMVTLALRAYRLEHRRYPASLTELTPVYLKKLPADPFAPKGTLLYHRQGQSYTLYSIGPDGEDDGGTPIDDPLNATRADADRRYIVEKNSVGDVVAGTNRW